MRVLWRKASLQPTSRSVPITTGVFPGLNSCTHTSMHFNRLLEQRCAVNGQLLDETVAVAHVDERARAYQLGIH